jgi:hypothetical protein
MSQHKKFLWRPGLTLQFTMSLLVEITHHKNILIYSVHWARPQYTHVIQHVCWPDPEYIHVISISAELTLNILMIFSVSTEVTLSILRLFSVSWANPEYTRFQLILFLIFTSPEYTHVFLECLNFHAPSKNESWRAVKIWENKNKSLKYRF